MKKNAILFLLLTFSFYGRTQKQLEFSLCNSLSVLRMYGSTISEDQAMMEGGAFDLYRNSLLVNINQEIQYINSFSYGLCYSINRFAFEERGAGMSRGPKSIPYDNSISHRYQSLAPFIGFKRICFEWNVKLFIGLNVFPQFVWGQKGHYFIHSDYGDFENGKSGLSHIDSRINLSMEIGDLYERRFVVNFFVQPPAIYITDIIKKRITYLNAGIGLGWTFNISKVNNGNE